MPGQPAQPGRRGDGNPVAALGVDLLRGALGDEVDGFLPGPGVHVRARPDLAVGAVVEHDTLAHAGRRYGADVSAGRGGLAERVLDAGGDELPVGVDVEVLAAGSTWRLAMGPLPEACGDLL